MEAMKAKEPVRLQTLRNSQKYTTEAKTAGTEIAELPDADVVKISDEEVEFLFGLGVQAGAQYILDHFPVKLVFVTCGADGCWFQNRSASGHVDSLKDIKVVDTTGAGDIFGGSAAYCLLSSGKAPEELNEEELAAMGRFACAAAGLSVQRPGGISSVPGKEEILALLAAGD